MYSKYLKRILDVISSIMLLFILAPLMLIISILVKIKLGPPVLFKQKRPGKKNKDGIERIFMLYKFRTMTDKKDDNGNLLPDNMRLTKFGNFLRESSLDELPELINILKGDMSIIGPRPQLVRDMVFMTEKQRERHNVTPGLTGLAQINGRNEISWEDKFKYDLVYIENISFLNDLKILVKTISCVIRKENINTTGMATAEDLGDYLLRTKSVDKKIYDEKQIIAKKIMEQVR